MLEKFVLTDDAPAYRQITDRLREAIGSGELPAGTRLPPIKRLAEKWATNYFTVQTALTPLENEGLIERTPRLGTFVAGTKMRLSSIGIYYGSTFWTALDAPYYQLIFSMLSDRLSEEFIKPHLWIDHRHRSPVQTKAWPPLVRMAQRREVQGIIALMITPADLKWLSRQRLPLAALTYADHPSSVNLDFEDMFDQVADRFARLRCRKVGLVISKAQEDRNFAVYFEKAAAARGLQIPRGAIVVAENPSSEHGYLAVDRLLSLRQVPEGLFVFPDSFCSGVTFSLLKRGIRVPEDLKLILHSNLGIDNYVPLPADRIVTNVDLLVHTLINHIRRQARGEAVKAVRLPLELRIAGS